MNLIPKEQRVTPKEVADELGCTRGTIQVWMVEGAADPTGRKHRLSSSKFGKRYYTTWDAVHTFLDAVSPGFGMPSISPQPDRLVELAGLYERARAAGDERADWFRASLAGAISVSAPPGEWVRAGGYSYRLGGDLANPFIDRREEGPAGVHPAGQPGGSQ